MVGTGLSVLTTIIVVAIQHCGRRCTAPAVVLYANRLRRRLDRGVWSQVRAPVRPGKCATDHQQRHDPTRFRTGLGVRADQDLLSGQGTISRQNSKRALFV